ncbi:glycosyltransferase family 2 protein [candidate division KSB1 bacterium]|nr:glycosyltransferase family 2 protein [candidate division KSB1 bacterium]
MQRENLSLSVVMPALNEEKNIAQALESTLAAFDRLALDGEILVVNDGSSDSTADIVRSFLDRDRRVKLINHAKPMGIGNSFFDGVQCAEKETIVMFPGDNENDPDDALSFVFLLEQVDIIVPFIHNSEIRNKSRRIVSSLYRLIVNLSFGIQLHYHNGTVFYNRYILDDVTLSSMGFFYQAELLIKLIRKGYLFAEVPNFLSQRLSGKSKALTWKSLVRVIKSFVKLFYEIHFLRIEGKKDYHRLHPRSVSYQKGTLADQNGAGA